MPMLLHKSCKLFRLSSLSCEGCGIASQRKEVRRVSALATGLMSAIA